MKRWLICIPLLLNACDEPNAGPTLTSDRSTFSDEGTQAASPGPNSGSPDAQSETPSSGDTLPAGSAGPLVDPAPTASPPDGIPCEVADIVSSRCAHCHADPPQFGAVSALTNAAAFQADSLTEPQAALHQVALARIGPGAASPMPPPSQPQLTEAERETLSAWLRAGAPTASSGCEVRATTAASPTGDVSASGAPDAPEADDGLECFQLRAHAHGDKEARAWVGVASDLYANFVFAAPWGDRPGYAVVLRPIIDNARVLHHWLLFRRDTGTEEEDGAIVRSNGLHPEGELVAGWAPGGVGLDFRDSPDDVAFDFPPGTYFDLEIHYNSDDANAEDASGVEICIKPEKPRNPLGISWLGSDLFGLLGKVSTVRGECVPRSREPIHVVRVSPHMHLEGKHATATIHRATGETEILHDAPFAFEDQTFYERYTTIHPGDRITTRCDFHKPVAFGSKTEEEMCYMFVLAYPRGALTDNGLGGTLAHGGGSCLGY